MTKPRLVKVAPKAWQCRSPEFWSAGMTPKDAWSAWAIYMERNGLL